MIFKVTNESPIEKEATCVCFRCRGAQGVLGLGAADAPTNRRPSLQGADELMSQLRGGSRAGKPGLTFKMQMAVGIGEGQAVGGTAGNLACLRGGA